MSFKTFLFEFYFIFIINAKRETRHRLCSYGLDCIRLKLRAIFVLMNEMSITEDGMTKYMRNIDGLLLTTDKRRENTREYHNCKGNHML